MSHRHLIALLGCMALAPFANAGEPAPAPQERSASDVPLDKVVALWPRVLERVKEHSRVAWLLVRDCRPVSLSNSILTLTQSNAGAVAAFNQGGHGERIRQALLDELRMELTVEMTLGSDAPTPSQPQSRDPGPAAAADEPADDDEALESTAESGLELLQRELGGHLIAEYENE